MSRIESRPSKREVGEYVFFVDVDLSNEAHNVEEKLMHSLSPLCEHLVHFGSYQSSEVQIE